MEKPYTESIERIKQDVAQTKATRKKVVVEFSAEDHKSLMEFVTARETTISKVFRTIWREYRNNWQREYGWPPRPLDSMNELVK